MKNTVYILVSLLFIFLFSVCQKEDDLLSNPDNIVTDTLVNRLNNIVTDTLISRPDYIVIDPDELLVVHTYDPFIEVHIEFSGWYEDTFNIDINDDGVNDIQFAHDYTILRQETGGFSEIRCLHDNVFIETFFHIDTLIRFNTIEGDTLLTINTTNYSGQDEYENFQIFRIDSTLCPVIKNSSDTIHGSLEWRSGSFTLSNSYSMYCELDGNGFECYPQQRVNYHHGAWIDIENKFIAIKMEIEGEEWYSWIQISCSVGISIYRYRRIWA
ncbi:MAG: hypothetical protein JXB49_31270 [Bacteroidales bacterium]|nr:hypothetical protein [Bacteroidales bacterium]